MRVEYLNLHSIIYLFIYASQYDYIPVKKIKIRY